MATAERLLFFFPDPPACEKSIWLWLVADCLTDRTKTTYAWPWEKFCHSSSLAIASHSKLENVPRVCGEEAEQLKLADSLPNSYYRLVWDGRALTRQAIGKVHRS